MTKVYKILNKYTGGFDKVLDIGFGSGRDLLDLKGRGINILFKYFKIYN